MKLGRDWWTNPDYSHGFVVLPLALALVWSRRRELAETPVAPSAGVFAVTVGADAMVVKLHDSAPASGVWSLAAWIPVVRCAV